MKKNNNYFKNFFSDFTSKSAGYYVVFGLAFAVALVSMIAGNIVSSALAFAGATAVPAVLCTLGFVLYIVLFFLGHEKIGTGLVAVFSYSSFIATFCNVFEYYLGVVQEQGMSGGFNIFAIEGIFALIIGVVLFLYSAIMANVLAFIPAGKKKKVQLNIEENTEAVKDEIN